MKYLIIGLALLAFAGAAGSYTLYRNNQDLRQSVKDADARVETAHAKADGWKLAYGQSVLASQQDNTLMASIDALRDTLRADAAKSQQTYLSYLRSKSNDPTACENQPVPGAVYTRLGVRGGTSQGATPGAGSPVPQPAR